jgi:hypothetical protein
VFAYASVGTLSTCFIIYQYPHLPLSQDTNDAGEGTAAAADAPPSDVTAGSDCEFGSVPACSNGIVVLQCPVWSNAARHPSPL